MGLRLGNRGWPQKLSQRRLKQDQNRLYHRQLRGKLKSERQRGLLHRSNNGRKAAADLRTVVLNRKTVTTCRLFISVKRTKQPSAEASTEIAQADSTAMQQRNADSGSNQETIPARSGNLDRNSRDPATSNPGDQPTQAPGKKKGPSKKARLVSYSSQDDSRDDTRSIASRRSGRKRMTVTKMEGVMIDFINQSEKEGKK